MSCPISKRCGARRQQSRPTYLCNTKRLVRQPVQPLHTACSNRIIRGVIKTTGAQKKRHTQIARLSQSRFANASRPTFANASNSPSRPLVNQPMIKFTKLHYLESARSKSMNLCRICILNCDPVVNPSESIRFHQPLNNLDHIRSISGADWQALGYPNFPF